MVLVIATTGLVYELAIAALASYVLGDSVTQFSLVIGAYLSAMGLGAWCSRFISRRLEVAFIDVELATALVGGLSAPLLFVAHAMSGAFQLLLFLTVGWVGVLVGLELPLLIRILERRLELKELIARALSWDYAGALVGSVGFSMVLVPKLGLIESTLACGSLNALVALGATSVLPATTPELARGLRRARLRAGLVLAALVIAWLRAGDLTAAAESSALGGAVTLSQQTHYQRLVLTEQPNGDFQLYLNGNLQFSSTDEHRYHEALVHPVMASVPHPRRVLIGGGGDGLALREILRWPEVEHVSLVDLDPAMTELARHHPRLAEQNRHALEDARVEVVNADAMVWFAQPREPYDVIVLDFPDPTNFSLGKLYSTRFYAQASALLAPRGALAVQATSPYFARASFWCIVSTLREVGFTTRPYRVFVPSFGDWGYVLAARGSLPIPTALPPGPSRYLDPLTLAALFELPTDVAELPTEVNHLNNQALVTYYQEEWLRWN